jgi:hypothetical protein
MTDQIRRPRSFGWGGGGGDGGAELKNKDSKLPSVFKKSGLPLFSFWLDFLDEVHLVFRHLRISHFSRRSGAMKELKANIAAVFWIKNASGIFSLVADQKAARLFATFFGRFSLLSLPGIKICRND